jgi:ABC-type nitrate/sulfonate/bicarbonate transport system ATPase subunit
MSRDPGRIIRSVDVPFGRPRDRSIRTEPEFQQLRADLSAELRAVAGDLEAR